MDGSSLKWTRFFCGDAAEIFSCRTDWSWSRLSRRMLSREVSVSPASPDESVELGDAGGVFSSSLGCMVPWISGSSSVGSYA